MRVRGAKTEMEELGLETDGMAESTSKLQAELKALTGIDIMIDKNTFMSTYDMMGAIAAKWEDLNDIQRASVTELIAGKRQGNIISSMMTNWDVAEQALKTSQESAGSAMSEHEKWMQSLEARINQLKAAWQGLSQAFMSSDFLKGLLDGVINLVQALEKLIDTFGTLPTLIGAFGMGKAMFGKNGGIFSFDTNANQFQFFGKSLDQIKGKFSGLSKVTAAYRSEAARASTVQSLYGKNVAESSLYMANFGSKMKTTGKAAAGVGKEFAKTTAKTLGAKAATVGLSVASTALSGVMSMGIGMAISLVISGITKLINAKKELSKHVDEVTSKYKEQHEELIKNKADFDSSSETSAVSKYAELSKGVNSLGENVSLTSSEYEEYLEVTNKIAASVPSLVAGYDAQGNAILNTKGNVEELVAAYEKLIQQQNNEILDKESGDIEKDFKNKVADFKTDKPFEEGLTTDVAKGLEEMLSKGYDEEQIGKYLNDNFASTLGNVRSQIREALEDAGVDVGLNPDKALAETIATNPEKIRGIVNSFKADFDEAAEDMKTIAEATLSNAFDISSSDYAGISEEMQNVIRSVVNSFDGEFYAGLSEKGISVETYITDMLDEFKSIDESGRSKKLEAVFNLKTQFDNGDISYGEYVSQLKEAESLIDSLNLDEEVKSQIKLALNTEEITTEYDNLKTRLTSEEYEIQLSSKEATEFLDGLSSEEYSVAMKVIEDFEPMSNDEIQAEFDKYEKGGNVDLTLRPKVDPSELKDAGWKDVGEAAATVFTSTFSNTAGDVAVNFTPIVTDKNGKYKKTLSPEALKKYAEEVIAGTRDDDLKLQIGAEFKGEDAIEQAERAAERIHQLQDYYYNGVSAQLYSAIDMMKAIEGATFDLDFTSESEGIEGLNTALQESVSATGLSASSITALKSRYAELASQGYDLSAMFEETSNGIHLNKNALGELEQAYAQQKQNEISEDLNNMQYCYDILTEKINNCTDASERASLYTQRDELAQRINDAGTLAAQYEGLTSAYKAWQDAESAGSERDMYENVIKGFDTVKDEISRGWIDDGSIKFLELLTGRTDLATASTKELKKVYKGLDKDINSAGYSVRDFFTVDDEGNSTNTGVYNFLETVEAQYKGVKDVIEKDSDGNIIGFDFNVVGGDEAVAEALGISEELVQIMLRAADDAGFVVSLDGNYTQLADLKTAAKEANTSLNKLYNDSNKKFGTNHEFNFGASSAEELNAELEKAVDVLDQFKDKNGQIKKDKNGNYIEGAQEALDIASYFTATIDKLSEPVYMQLETNQVEKNLQKPLTKMQEFERLSKEKHQLQLTGDKEKLKETEKEMGKIVDYLKGLDTDTKVDLGIEGLSKKEIESKLEKGEIEIPATVDIQMEMSEDIKDMRLMMMNQLGLISDEELKLELEYDIDTTEVDEYEPEQQEAIVKFIEDHKEVDEYKPEEKEAAIKYVAEGGDLDGFNEEERKIAVKFLADTDNLEDYTPEEKEAIVNYAATHEEVDDYTPEEKKAVAKFIADGGDLDNYTPEEKEAFVKYIADGGEVGKWTPEEKLAFAKYLVDGGNVEGWTPEQKDALVKYLADGGDVEGWDAPTKQAFAQYLVDGGDVSNWTPETKEAFAKYIAEHGSVDSWTPEQKNALAKYLKESSEVDNYNPKNHDRSVTYKKDSSKVDNYNPKNYNRSVTYSVTASIAAGAKKILNAFGIGVVNGTANVNGTAYVNGTLKKSGRAFKRGDWGTKEKTTALTGELGQELIVPPNGSTWYTVGDNGAEFVDIPKGSIVFNHKQTEELFKNGKVTSGNGRGRVLANGTAFAEGTAFSNGYGGTGKVGGGSGGGSGSGSGNNGGGGNGGGSTDNKDFKETFDWIEIAISRIEREIDRLDTQVNRTYTSWKDRNKYLTKEISKVSSEIKLQEKAYNRYIKQANKVGLSSSWKKKVREGKVDISTIKNEKLAEKIKNYQEWFEKALACKDAILELEDTEMDLYKQSFDNIVNKYDAYLSLIEHDKSMLEEYISQSEEKGYITSTKYYDALIQEEQKNIDKLKAENKELIAARNAFVKAGGSTDSEDYYEMTQQINDNTLAIQEGTTKILEYGNAIRDIDWQVFDLIQERISNISEEANFLIDLMSNDKLYDDNGQLTNEGMATMGLHGQNYNTYMAQADNYATEINRLNKEIAKDPYNQDLINRRNELIEAQQDSIKAAEDEKQAIKDLVSEGIELELNALQERIDKYNESLDVAKDLYDYNKKVKEQTKEIASLEKELAAYQGDTSEEARQKIQQIKVSLEDAKDELKDTEYDRYISEQQKILDDLYDEYEEILNQRLDNIDALLENMIEEVNNNAETIKTTIEEKSDGVGYTLSEEMQSIWNTGSGSIKTVLTTYGSDFSSKLTTVNTTLNNIKIDIDKMIAALNKDATSKTSSSSSTSSSSTSSSNSSSSKTTTSSTSSSAKTIKVGGKIKATGAKIYDYKGDKTGETQYYKKDPIYKVLKIDGSWIQARYHKLTKGVSGWFKKSDVKAYKTGSKSIKEQMLAWTQENGGREFIVRKSDGAILTPLAKNDSVLSANASNNIWDMANDPSKFIKNNLDLNIGSVPNNVNVENSFVQNLDKVVFSFPNVQSYDEMLTAMQRDKNFEKLILSMSIDRIAGKSSLAKNKVFR